MDTSNRKTELLVGLFVFFGLVLLGGLILQFSNIREWLRDDYPLHVFFRDSAGLTENSPVRYSGNRIGRVKRVVPRIHEQNGVRVTTGAQVELGIYSEFNIPRGSRFTVAKEGLLGDSYINITPPPQGQIVDVYAAGEVVSGAEGGGLDDLQKAANEISAKTQEVLEGIRAGLVDLNKAIEKVNTGVLSDENLGNFKDSLSRMKSAVTRLDESVLDEENVANVKTTLQQIRSASDNIAAQSQRLDSLMDRGETAMTNFGAAAESFKKSGDTFNEAAGRAGRTINDINHGDGLMSALIHDPGLRQDFRDLVYNMKEHGVLFYRDSAGKIRERRPPSPPPRVPSR